MGGSKRMVGSKQVVVGSGGTINNCRTATDQPYTPQQLDQSILVQRAIRTYEDGQRLYGHVCHAKNTSTKSLPTGNHSRRKLVYDK